ELRDLFARLLGDEPLNAAAVPLPATLPPAPAHTGGEPAAPAVPAPRSEAETGNQDRDRDPGTAAPGDGAPDGTAGTTGSIALGRIDTGIVADEAPAEPVPGEPHPMQLPADIVDFTGRDLHVQRVCDLLSAGDAEDSPGAVPVALVAGAGGLGKTTLAIHSAHRLRARYPDGHLYVDLQGATGQPLAPPEVLARFLRDLGVGGGQIPAGQEERAAQFRTRLNGRRMLILLDNARDAAQVRPLLPGTATCAVIVTSRSRLPDLVGGGLVHLEVLDDAEALTMFSRIVGAPRAAAEPDATAEVLVACAGLPLAIRICAARLAARRSWSIQSLADRLHDEHRRLDELKVGDLAVRASFEVSFASLPPAVAGSRVPPAHALRMLGLWRGSTISLPAAAALLGEPETEVEEALEFLVDAHLLESPGPDCYGFHDLVRVYAAERALAEEAEPDRHDAIYRVIAWYLHTASAADAIVTPQRDRVPIETVPSEYRPLSFRDVGSALSWAERERMNLVAATEQAAEYDLHDAAWRLPVAVLGCFDTLSCRTEWVSSHLVALDSTRHEDNRRGEAWVLNNLGQVHGQMQLGDAIGYYEEALAIRRDIGDRRGEAQTANNLAHAHLQLGRAADALDPANRALVLQREVGHRYGEGVALDNLGEAYLALGQWDEAIGWLQRARTLFAELNMPHGEGYALHNLGQAYLGLGRLNEALHHFREALAIRRASGERHIQAITLLFLGRTQARMGRLADARRSWTEAAAVFDELNDEELASETRGELDTLSNDIKVLP
ncbi:MAG TPA: tetratricopeptide repeat protein, partial [Streptosporangiaceae bacterium]|nr:tetratricopeptide repeat protein [Streptosporangiaceae bacterium]